MKGQLTIQYLASFIFFIGLIVYVYFAYSANIPRFVQEVDKEDLRSKAYQLSEVLVNDPGHPINWDGDSVDRIGFSDHHSNKKNLISKSKIDGFNNAFNCDTDFEDVQKKLALNESFSILIFNITDDGRRESPPLLSCISPTFPTRVINATVKRITAWNDSGTIKLAELVVQM